MSMLDESGRDAHRIDTEFVSDRSTRGGWRRVEFPIGLSCDTLGEKFRGKGATDWGIVDAACKRRGRSRVWAEYFASEVVGRLLFQLGQFG
jgi:hypothetical protein